MEVQEVLKLSFDFDISVRIKDKRTGDIISGPKVIPAPASDYAGYEEICWWASSLFLDLPPAIFRICGKYMGKQYLLEEGAEGIEEIIELDMIILEELTLIAQAKDFLLI